MPAAFRLTLGLYYLALGTWFGATLMMGLSAGLTFATVRAQPLVLTEGPAATPEMAARAQDFLAGNVVMEGFAAFTIVQLCCAGVLIVLWLLQHTVFRPLLAHRGRSRWNLVRSGMIGVALAVFAYDLVLVRTSMVMLRTEMYYHDHIDAQGLDRIEVEFDRLHRWSSRAMGVAALLMAAACVASPGVFVGPGPADREVGDG